ncbi:MAG: hypothetical protein IJ079_03155 [Lachnospiraceae bacterium]|nr:hypothetical protein [Lachnospiraceae bacterium]
MKLFNSKKWKAGIAALAATAMVLATSVMTYADGYGTSTGDNSNGPGAIVDENGELVEFEVSLEDLGITMDDIVYIGTSGGDIGTRYVSGYISGWTIPSGQMVNSSAFKKNAGDTITITCSIVPDDKTVQVGIIKPNGGAVCVQGTDYFHHTFSCISTGYYCVFVKNLSTSSITAYGMYTF